MQPKHKQPNSWQPGCVSFHSCRRQLVQRTSLPSPCQHHCHVFMSSAQCLSSKERYFHSHYRDQSLVTLVLLELSTMIFSGSSPLIILITITTIQKSYRNIYSLPLFCLKHLFPQLPGVLAAYCSHLRPSLGLALSCPTQGHILPWEHSTSNVCSVGGGRKPGKEGVGPTLWSSP